MKNKRCDHPRKNWDRFERLCDSCWQQMSFWEKIKEDFMKYGLIYPFCGLIIFIILWILEL